MIMKKINRRDYLAIFSIIAIFTALFLIGRLVPEQSLRMVIEKAGPWGVIVLIFSLWITNVIAPLSGSPFLFVGFYSYGQMSVVYAFIAAVIASITNFWIARIWGRNLVIKLAGEKNLEKIDSLTKDYGLQTLFIFRVFLKEFHDVISYAFGLTNLKFKPYFLISTLGMIPATFIWYLISLKIRDPLTFTTVSWIFAYFSLIVYFAWIKLRKRKK
jgi:uncharacterized membrane protein YdjX (TVP38/TMEM64 family)